MSGALAEGDKVKRSWLLAAVAACVLSGTAASAQMAPALDRLKNDLHLTPPQEAAWGPFAQAYKGDPQTFAKQQKAQASMPTLTGPQRVDLAIGLAKEDLADLERRGDALKAFYATLSPEQQRIFDRDTLPPEPER